MEKRIEALVEQLTLEEKVSLLSGADNWHTRAIERLGIPAIRMTDGPHGVRYPNEDDQGSQPASSFPTASAMAATWNVDLMQRVGKALAVETKTKGCDILLGPAVNIHRAPLCGRNFEYYSEDPHLAGRMAVAWIKGIQSRGVGASLKHYAANNQEFERFTISAEIDERALREIYLPAFEAAVKEADPWTVMCSYNKINGTWSSENPYLLTDILKKEWGFQGFVVSDWGAVHHRIRSTRAGLDLEMPGMGDMPMRLLLDGIKNGQLPVSAVDEAVRRILRVVFLARPNGQMPILEPGASDTPEHRQLAREAAEEAVVLLKNEGKILPLDDSSLRSIAVFGPAAATAHIQGGGSAHVNPYYTVSPLEAIRQRAGDKIEVLYSQGCTNRVTPPVLDNAYTRTTGSAGDEETPGLLVRHYSNPGFSGEPFFNAVTPEARLSMRGISEEAAETLRKELGGKSISARWEGKFTAPVSGEFTFGLTSAGKSRMLIDGQVVVDHWTDPNLSAFMSVWPWQSKYGTVKLQEGQTVDLVIEYISLAGGYRLRASYDVPLPADEMERVTRMAGQADVAVVCVGTTWEHETEGYDRSSWELPGEQARLIRTVAKANPRTVVVLYNGGPVEIASWIGRVPALLESWFNGQETGNALAGILFGDVNPSGKLPDTYPVHFQDDPSFLNYPGENGKVLYGEGIFVGYRYYDAKDLEPLFPFGFGLSYTTFTYENLRLSRAEAAQGEPLEVSVDIRNTGSRAGKEVVQLYVRDLESRLARPPKELKAFQKVTLNPGEYKSITFQLNQRDFAYYDPSKKDWVAEAGVFEILVGSSSRDIRASARFTLLPGSQPRRPRYNEHTNLAIIMNDSRGMAILEKHLPHLVGMPDVRRFAEHINLSRISLTFMEILPPEKLQAVLEDLAQID